MFSTPAPPTRGDVPQRPSALQTSICTDFLGTEAGSVRGIFATCPRLNVMKEIDRRAALKTVAGSVVAGGVLACSRRIPEPGARDTQPPVGLALDEARVASTFRLERNTPFPTFDPFLFCVHHQDAFPAGNGRFGPNVPLAGRNLGQDFSAKDGFSMYHGREIPGFPRHPHRGFETITVVRQGRLDHSDSLGARARYGDGDVQWLTAGAGIEHAEMFPLLSERSDNPLDLFQIWLNLPGRSKFASPAFSMIWANMTQTRSLTDDEGHPIQLTVRAGALGDLRVSGTPPDSWAADPKNDVAVATIELGPGARFRLPPALPGSDRALYLISGAQVALGQVQLHRGYGARLDSHLPLTLQAGSDAVELLLLQGRPIGEPVAKRGPFVMNSDAELRQAYVDYRKTEFGGWPWESAGPVHGTSPERFALRPDGKIEKPT